jgi:hypothetical protein
MIRRIATIADAAAFFAMTVILQSRNHNAPFGQSISREQLLTPWAIAGLLLTAHLAATFQHLRSKTTPADKKGNHDN